MISNLLPGFLMCLISQSERVIFLEMQTFCRADRHREGNLAISMQVSAPYLILHSLVAVVTNNLSSQVTRLIRRSWRT